MDTRMQLRRSAIYAILSTLVLVDLAWAAPHWRTGERMGAPEAAEFDRVGERLREQEGLADLEKAFADVEPEGVRDLRNLNHLLPEPARRLPLIGITREAGVNVLRRLDGTGIELPDRPRAVQGDVRQVFESLGADPDTVLVDTSALRPVERKPWLDAFRGAAGDERPAVRAVEDLLPGLVTDPAQPDPGLQKLTTQLSSYLKRDVIIPKVKPWRGQNYVVFADGKRVPARLVSRVAAHLAVISKEKGSDASVYIDAGTMAPVKAESFVASLRMHPEIRRARVPVRTTRDLRAQFQTHGLDRKDLSVTASDPVSRRDGFVEGKIQVSAPRGTQPTRRLHVRVVARTRDLVQRFTAMLIGLMRQGHSVERAARIAHNRLRRYARLGPRDLRAFIVDQTSEVQLVELRAIHRAELWAACHPGRRLHDPVRHPDLPARLSGRAVAWHQRPRLPRLRLAAIRA